MKNRKKNLHKSFMNYIKKEVKVLINKKRKNIIEKKEERNIEDITEKEKRQKCER